MKHIKRYFSFAIVFVFVLFGLFSLNVKATALNTSSSLMVTGASVRTAGNVGLRFEGSVNEMGTPSGTTIESYGICFAYGIAEKEDLFLGNTVNGKDILYAIDEAGLKDNKFYVTLYNIPSEVSSYIQNVTARAYVVLNNKEIIYSTDVITRNICDVATEAYSEIGAYETDGNLVKVVAEATKLRVQHSGESTVNYYGDFDDITIVAGDTLTLKSGIYESPLTISVNDVKVYGPNASKEISSNGTRENGLKEAKLTNVVRINAKSSNTASNVEINGLEIYGDNSFKLYCNQSNISFKYNICKPTSNSAIIDGKATSGEYKNYIHENITIENNYIYLNVTESSDGTHAVGINIRGYSKNVTIKDNYIESANTTLKADEFGIKLSYVEASSYVSIKNNSFKVLGANYVIDIGSSHTTSNRINAYINIENNNMTSSITEFLNGNCIRVAYLDNGSMLNILGNHNICTKSYYNALLISTQNTAKANDEGINPNVKIMFNHFYGNLPSSAPYLINEETGETSTEVRTSRSKVYSCVGIGLPTTANVVYEGSETKKSNYIKSGTDTSTKTAMYRFGYASLSAKTGGESTFDISGMSNVGSVNTTNSLYSSYASTNTSFSSYILEFNVSNDTVSSTYENDLQVQNSKLVYIGTDAAYAIAAIQAGLTVGTKVIE